MVMQVQLAQTLFSKIRSVELQWLSTKKNVTYIYIDIDIDIYI